MAHEFVRIKEEHSWRIRPIWYGLRNGKLASKVKVLMVGHGFSDEECMSVVAQLTGHSGRVTGACLLHERTGDLGVVQQAGRWRSMSSALRYSERSAVSKARQAMNNPIGRNM